MSDMSGPNEPVRRKPRPSVFSPRLAKIILEKIAEGELLLDICQQSGMPTRATVRRWRTQNEAFAKEFELARIASAEAMEDEMIDTLRGAVDKELVPHASALAKGLQWSMARRARARYAANPLDALDPDNPEAAISGLAAPSVKIYLGNPLPSQVEPEPSTIETTPNE